jgi:DNA mismatch repair ATPase MutS
MLVHLALSVLFTGAIHTIFDAVTGQTGQVRHYREMLIVCTRLPRQVGHVDLGGVDLRDVARSGIAGLNSLKRILRYANARRDGFFGVLYFLIQLAVLWDFHILAWLEVWQRRWRTRAPQWLAAIGQIEAFASLASAAYNHPEWTYPTVDPAAKQLRARDLGHPLLPNERRVCNDVEIGPPGTFLLVTGSNMSGKSTLLRSLGVNVLLAQAGGVVCAREMVLPPLDVETSMRVADSLADGVSFFLAELVRLKQIVDRAASDAGSQRCLLYLLDEILQGTNSRERRLAVLRVIGHLLDQGAIGAVSTHDLELAACPELRDACRVVHFRETLSTDARGRKMSFDYKLHPGLAPTTNALLLLEMVGLADS